MILKKYHYLIKSFGSYSISNALSQILMLVYSFLLANHLGPAIFGIYSGHYSFILLFSFIINWGFDPFFLFQSGSLENQDQINKFTGKIIFTKLLLGGLWIPILLIIPQYFGSSFFTTGLILLASFGILSEGIFLTQLTALNIKNETIKLSFLLFFSRLGKLIGVFGIIYFNISQVSIIFLIRLLTTLAFMLLSIIISKAHVNYFSIGQTKKLWISSAHYGLSEAMASIYAQVDISLLAIMLGDIETGLYSTSSRLIITLFSIPYAIYLLTIPKLRNKYINDRVNFLKYFLKIQLGFLLIGLFLFLGIFISGKWIISLVLIDAYSISGELIQILSIVLLIKSLNFGLGAFLVSLNWQKYRLIPQFITSILAILLNIIFIPVLGLFGAAYVYIISESILFIGYVYLTVRWYKMNWKIS